MYTESMKKGIVKATGRENPSHSEHVEIGIPHKVSMPDATEYTNMPKSTIPGADTSAGIGCYKRSIPSGNPLFVGTEDVTPGEEMVSVKNGSLRGVKKPTPKGY